MSSDHKHDHKHDHKKEAGTEINENEHKTKRLISEIQALRVELAFGEQAERLFNHITRALSHYNEFGKQMLTAKVQQLGSLQKQE